MIKMIFKPHTRIIESAYLNKIQPLNSSFSSKWVIVENSVKNWKNFVQRLCKHILISAMIDGPLFSSPKNLINEP